MASGRQLSISVHFVRMVLQHAVAQGQDPVQLLRQTRISPRLLEEDDARISAARFADLQVNTMLAMEDEGLGYGSQKLPIGSWSMMCHAVIHCDTLGKALARYCRFFGLFQQSTHPRLINDGELACVRVVNPGRNEKANSAGDEYAAELALYNCHRFMSWLVQEHIPVQTFNFDHPAPPHEGEYRPMFLANPVHFDQPHSEMVLNRALLEKPVLQNEQSLSRYLRHPVLTMLVQQFDKNSWTIQVKKTLRRNMEQMPELDDVSRTLDLHPQTLRRRLASEGSSFSEIKSQLRRDVALHYLGKQGISIEEIAHRAGFSESSAFIRAFKGWTGVTPYTYRKGL